MAMLASLLPWRSGAWPSSLSHLAGDPLATSHQQDQPEQPDTSRPLAFFVLGDWGDPVDSHGLAVASVMQAMHSLAPVDMVLFLGDNFYGTGQPGTDGVASVDDPKWTKLWLSAYGRLTHIPWLGVLGNHDWNGNIDAQLAYHGVNPSWNMEDLFWERVMAVGSREAAFIFIDTDLLYYGYAGDPGSPMEERFRARGWTPENRVVEAQLKWIEAALQRHADQPWVFVIGHHELGACPASHHMAQLLNLFQLYKPTAYFAGHIHAMQHAHIRGTDYIISGAGSRNSSVCDGFVGWGIDGVNGFVHAQLRESSFQFEVVAVSDGIGRSEYKRTSKPRQVQSK